MTRLDDRRRLALCAFLSGAAGLIYEILWSRRLTETFGHTTLAVATASAAFMAGLAIGSLAADPLARRRPEFLLRFYALAEIGIGLFGWLSSGWLGFVARWAGIHPSVGGFTGTSGAAWLALFIAALAPGTLLMGLTLPLLVLCARDRAKDAAANSGLDFGLVYGWNALGGVLGCLLAGVALPPSIGVGGSLRAAAGLSFSAAIVAATVAPAPALGKRGAGGGTLRAGFVGLSFLSGAIAMACEISWLRLAQLLLGSSIQTVGLMLAVIVLGLGLGSLAYNAASRRWPIDADGWVWLQFGLAASLLAGLYGYDRLVYFGAFILPDPRFSYGGHLVMSAFFCAAIALPACVVMGLSLPWLFGLACEQQSASEVGIFYGTNAGGCIAGAASAAFYLLPAWGMERTIRGAALIVVAAAGAVALRRIRTSAAGRRQLGFAAALAGAVVFLPKALDPAVLSSGVYLYGAIYREASSFAHFKALAASAPIVYYADGISATVAVKDDVGGRRLEINGKADASAVTDRLTQLVIGYVPLLINPTASRALVVGLGTGMTAQALSQSDRMRTIRIVELEPRVAEAAELFDSVNGGILQDPRVSIVFDDARRVLASDPDAYDIIAAEPSNPWISGAAGLYTRENFENARARLAPHGVFCQWLNAYGLSQRDFRSVLTTFAAVFPRVLLFRAGSPFDYVMAGSNDGWPAAAYADGLVDRSRPLREALASLKLGKESGGPTRPPPEGPEPAAPPRAKAGPGRISAPFELLAGEFALGDRAFRRAAAGARLNTDEYPSLEFSAPQSLYAGDERGIYDLIENARAEETPSELFPDKIALDTGVVEHVVGEASIALGDLPRGLRLAHEAYARAPADARSGTDYAQALIRASRPDEAETILLAVITRHPDFAPAYFHLADLHAMIGDTGKALSWAEHGLRLDPYNPRANMSAGSLYLGEGKKAAARRAFERGLKGAPLDEPTRQALQTILARWK